MAATGTAPRRSRESSTPLAINRSAGLRLSMIFAPKALHLLFLLVLGCNLDLDPRTPRWPPMTPGPNNDGQFLADGRRLQGPHMPSGRFADSPRSRTRSRSRPSSSTTTSQNNRASTDSASGPDLPPAPMMTPRTEHQQQGDDGTDESGSWSDTSLDLGGRALAQAVDTLLGMYRNQLQRTALLSNRELYVSQHARRILDGEDLANWQTFEQRATHEYRPHRRPAADDC